MPEHAFGVGFEPIAVQTARQRGISVVNGAGSNADCVADRARLSAICSATWPAQAC